MILAISITFSSTPSQSKMSQANNLIHSQYLQTDVAHAFDKASHLPNQARLNLIVASHPGRIICALLAQMGQDLFEGTHEARPNLPITVQNIVATKPEDVVEIFSQEQKAKFSPLEDVPLMLHAIENYLPTLTPVEEQFQVKIEGQSYHPTFKFDLFDGTSFIANLGTGAAIMQLYFGMLPLFLAVTEKHFAKPEGQSSH